MWKVRFCLVKPLVKPESFHFFVNGSQLLSRKTLGQHKMSGHYSFPILQMKEILVCLKELSIPMTKDELKTPTSEKMLVVYEMLVEGLMNLNKDDFRQPPFGALDVLSHPELHESSIPEMSFYKHLLRLMKAAGLHDCTLTHIVNPEYKSTKRILSALINFAKFREERLAIYQEFTTRTVYCLGSFSLPRSPSPLFLLSSILLPLRRPSPKSPAPHLYNPAVCLN